MRYLIPLFLLVAAPAWAEIPANTWVELTPDPCTGDLCVDDVPHFRGYSGSSIGNGYIWWWGGGHKAGPYNSIDAYNIAENRWEAFTTAEDIRNTNEWDHLTAEEKETQLNTWGAGRGPLYWSPLGRFPTNHSYGWQLWNPGRSQWCGLFPYPPDQHPVYVCYDPAMGDESGEPAASGTDPTQPDGAFSIVSDTVPDWGTGRHGAGLTWDSRREQVVMVQVAGGSGIWRYDAEADAWNEVAPFLIRGDGKYNEGYVEYHPGMDAYFTARKRSGGMQYVDAETGEPTLIADPPTSLLTYSIEYSPELDRMLIADTVDDVAHVYAYDPSADAWEEVQLGGAVPTNSTLGYDLLDRDPETGQYFLIRQARQWNRTDGVYTFRLTADALDQELTPCPVDACAGDGFSYASVQAAIDDAAGGDVIALADRDYEQCAIIDRPITLTAISGRPHMRDRVCDTKGVIVNTSPGTVTVEGIEVSGASDEKAVWHAGETMVLRDVLIHDSGMGVLSGPQAESLQVLDSELHSMDDPNEKAHFVYGGESTELVVRNTYLHGGTDGHFIKAKSVHSTIVDNVIEQQAFTDINLIDVWACGDNVVSGNTITTVDTTEAVTAIGITKRTSEAEPCPVEGFSLVGEGNTFVKNGEARWSRFVDNRWTEDAPPEQITLSNNNVTNAVYYRDKDRQFDTEAEWLAWSEGTGADDPAPETAPLTLTGGMYQVIDGDTVVSEHVQLKEALESATTQIANGATGVEIHREPIRVEGDVSAPVTLTGGMHHVEKDEANVSDHWQMKEALESALTKELPVTIRRDDITVERD